jgi:hypothetical protein
MMQMQLNETQREPLIALIQLSFCYQLQTALVSPDAQLSCYSNVATIFHPTLYVVTTDVIWTDALIYWTHAYPNYK